MTTKIGPSRILGPLALACVLAGACATSNAPPSQPAPAGASSSTSAADRDSVVRCCSSSYRNRTGVGPTLDDKTDKAAEQLLAKNQGNPKRACEAVKAALASSSCGAGSTLTSVAACDGRMGRSANDLDPATKAQLETGVRDRENQSAGPSHGGF